MNDSVSQLLARGDELVKVARFRSAICAYDAALDVASATRAHRDTQVELLTARGDCAFLAGMFDVAVSSLQEVVHFGDLCRPFVYLRLGQAQLELGALDEAADQLYRAFVLGRGVVEFAGQDRKYLTFLQSRLNLR